MLMSTDTAQVGNTQVQRDGSAPFQQSLLWIEQDIKPAMSSRANTVPAAVDAILRRIHRNEMQLFLDVCSSALLCPSATDQSFKIPPLV
jgi:hypothetical protein